MRMMLNKGLHVDGNNEVRIFNEETVNTFLEVVDDVPYRNSRALGWDTVPWWWYPRPCGQSFSRSSFGHTGYTGTTLWADRENDIGFVSMTNRVYPDDSKSVSWFRNNLANLLFEIIESEKEDQYSFLQ